MVIEQFLPFVSNYEFFDKMGVKIYDNGHSYTGVNFSIHSKYSSMPEYEAQMETALRRRARARHLGRDPPQHRATTRASPSREPFRPSGWRGRSPSTVRSSRASRCAWWARRESLLERSVMYNRLINAPTSVVGHDDLHCYRAIQEGLAAEGNEWVSLHRNLLEPGGGERGVAGTYNGTSEISVRGQFRAWLAAMTPDGGATLMSAIAEDGELIEFVYAEARLIDEKRFDEWYELFADDGRYWMPLTRGQQSGRTREFAVLRGQAAAQGADRAAAQSACLFAGAAELVPARAAGSRRSRIAAPTPASP